MFARRFPMFQLFSLELRNVGRKLGIVVAQRSKLLRIMAIDFGFDRVGAGHRCSLADKGRRSAERKARHAPQRLQSCRSNASIDSTS